MLADQLGEPGTEAALRFARPSQSGTAAQARTEDRIAERRSGDQMEQRFGVRPFDRDPRLSVFAPALFPTAPLYLGFFNFVESVPATILVIALVERELRRPRTGRAVALAIAAAALLYLHPSGLALALGAGAVLAATSGAPWKRQIRSLVAGRFMSSSKRRERAVSKHRGRA